MKSATAHAYETATRNRHRDRCAIQIAIVAAFVIAFTSIASAQGLNGEGVTGGFITPFAYTSPSPSNGFGHPAVSFHYLNAGPVIGDYFQGSVTVGFLKRVEIGYTHSFQSSGDTPQLSPMFAGGFNTFHGKFNFLPENTANKKFIPGLAVGFVARSNMQHVYGSMTHQETSSGDIYLVATKKITQTAPIPLMLNVGIKATNTSVFGMAGNAPYWQGRVFGGAALMFKGPARSRFAVGAEMSQEPHRIQGLNPLWVPVLLPSPPFPPGTIKQIPFTASVPTTLAYVLRVFPSAEKHPLNFDLAVTQAAGQIMSGTNVHARARVATGVTYRF